MKIIENDPNIPVNAIYPYKIVGGWEQTIDCDLTDLKKLYREIKKILDKSKNV